MNDSNKFSAYRNFNKFGEDFLSSEADSDLINSLISGVPEELRFDLQELEERRDLLNTGDRATGRNSSGGFFYCPLEFVPYMKAIFSGYTPVGRKTVWRELLWTYGKCRFVLLEVSNAYRNRVWHGLYLVTEICQSQDKLLTMICADSKNGMHLDFALYGIGEYSLSVIGLFNSRESGLDYRDFMMNKKLNQGWESYNYREIEQGLVKRYISVVVEHGVVRDLISVCRGLGLNFNKIVSKLVSAWLIRKKSTHSGS